MGIVPDMCDTLVPRRDLMPVMLPNWSEQALVFGLWQSVGSFLYNHMIDHSPAAPRGKTKYAV